MDINILSVPRKVPAELNLGGTTTTEKVFQDSALAAVVLPLPQSHIVCGKNSTWNRKTGSVQIVALGRVTGGTTTNFTLKLYYGTSTTVGSNTLLKASTARAVDSANHNWKAECNLVWDTDSQKLQGTAKFQIANLLDAEAAITNVPTSVDPTAVSSQASGAVNIGFVISGTFSSGNAGNLAYLDSFVLIAVA